MIEGFGFLCYTEGKGGDTEGHRGRGCAETETNSVDVQEILNYGDGNNVTFTRVKHSIV